MQIIRVMKFELPRRLSPLCLIKTLESVSPTIYFPPSLSGIEVAQLNQLTGLTLQLVESGFFNRWILDSRIDFLSPLMRNIQFINPLY